MTPSRFIAYAVAIPGLALVTAGCWTIYAATLLLGWGNPRDMPPPFDRRRKR